MRVVYLSILVSLWAIVPSIAQQSLLDSLLQLIDQRNPQLRSVAYTVEARTARAVASGKLPDPMLQGRVAPLPVETRNGPQQFGVKLEQRFPWFGVLEGQEQAAQAQAQAQALDYQTLRLQLHQQAKQLFARLYLLQWQQQFVQEHLQILRTIREFLLTRIQVGEENSGNLFRLDNEIAVLQQRLRSLRRQHRVATAQLFALFDALPDTNFRVSALPLKSRLPSLDSLIRLVERQNPVLARFKTLAAAAEFAAQSAKAKGYPSVGVGVDYVGIGTGQLTGEQAGQDAVMIGVRLSLPVDRTRYAALVEEQQAYRQQFLWRHRHQYRQFIAQLIQLVEDFEDQQDQLRVVQQTLIPNTQRALEILLEEYATGRVDIEIVLNTQRELLRYHEQEKMLEAQLFSLLAQKDFLLGIDR